MVTDRFANSNDSDTSCDTSDQKYCGGTWDGITNHLDYIQNMGFDAIWISPVVANIVADTGEGEGYHGSVTIIYETCLISSIVQLLDPGFQLSQLQFRYS